MDNFVTPTPNSTYNTNESFGNWSENNLDENLVSNSSDSIIIISNEQIFTLIVPYSIIFVLTILGNALVIITLSSNRRMRSVTNTFLLNLAISDLLLGVFCMPFTLVGVLLREFIFGTVMCRLIPYLQAVSVSVSAWTLVAMSVERYYAICHPLKSRESRQTLSHAYRMIAFVWMGSLITMSPIGIVSKLIPIRDNGKYKCRESWPSELAFNGFSIFLVIILLVVPLIIMILTYSLIAITLKRTININVSEEQNDSFETHVKESSNGKIKDNIDKYSDRLNPEEHHVKNAMETKVTKRWSKDRPKVTALRCSTDPTVAEARQRRIIKMLFVVVLEFFVCWTPLYTINTIALYDPKSIYKGLGYYGISFCHLLAFISSCTNPITYCFMNSKFRKSFLSLFGCTESDMENMTSTTFPSYSPRFNQRDCGALQTPAGMRKAVLHTNIVSNETHSHRIELGINT